MGFTPQNPNTFEPVANVTLTTDDSKVATSTIQKNVITPEEYMIQDFIEVPSASLRQLSEILNEAEGIKRPKSEILLGVSTCCIGGVLSALCSKIELNSTLGIIMYIVLPIIAVGTLVAYFLIEITNLAILKIWLNK